MTTAVDPARPVRAWLGRRDAVDLVGPLPEAVVLDDWDGRLPVPASLQQVEFYAVPFKPRDEITIDVLGGLPALRLVQVPVAGFEDVAGRHGPGVVLCNARGVHDAATADWVLAAMLAMIRELPTFVREQGGSPRRRLTRTLAGSRVLIVGYGSIGAAVERRLEGFDVEVLRVARRRRAGVHATDALPDLLPTADVVVVLVPAAPGTYRLVDSGFLARMRDGALLVNPSRGSVVDQNALAAELLSGRLTAAVDVAEPDPLPAGHPLLGLPGLLYTPHQAGQVVGGAERTYAFIGDQLRRYAAGHPVLNVVDRADLGAIVL